MALPDKKIRKDKEIVLEFEWQAKDIKQQLTEQLRCWDTRLEMQLAMLAELQEFFRRRAEVELEYSKGLERMVKNIMSKHKAEKQKRENWPGFSTYSCWQSLLQATRRQSRDHAAVAEIYNGQLNNRLLEISEDIQRIYKKCRETGIKAHEELVKVLNELYNTMKTYHQYHNESKNAESKLRNVESQRQKVEQHAGKGGTLGRKFRSIDKQANKKQAKYTENKIKALRARNEYLLSIDVANVAMNKYFVEDVSDILDCMDYGHHNTLQRAMLVHVSVEDNLRQCRQECTDRINKCVADLEQRADKQRFLEVYNQVFSLPKKFEFQPHKGDEVSQFSAQKQVQEELIHRCQALEERMQELRIESDETWKTIETADTSLMDMINRKDYDMTSHFEEEKQPPKSPHEHAKKRSDRLETEAYYLEKFNKYLLNMNLIGRLHAKSNTIKKAVGEGNLEKTTGARPPSVPPKPARKRKIGRAPLVGQPKLFGGSLEEYVEATGQEIPLVVTSCIRVINLHGMHHQGVFRVSGSQHEINDFKNAFEKGEDPLGDVSTGRDINSVAGVLKLYFRELREPLFPIQIFDQLMDSSQMELSDFNNRLKELLQALPRPIVIVMRYLFAFLRHLSEFSDENMMDPYNLAICYGPTLLPIPHDRDQVMYQSNVNTLIKNIIMYDEDIFPADGGLMYERLQSDDGDRDDSADTLSEEEEFADVGSEEEQEVLEAVALYDFVGRTERELSFKKNDSLVVFNQASTDWWEGAYQGKEGLIPDKYISIKQREVDEASTPSDDDKRRSVESLPAKPWTLLAQEAVEKSVSHPNISMASGTEEEVPVQKKPNGEDTKSVGSTPPSPLPPSRPSISSTLSSSGVSSGSPEGALQVSTEDIASDIDTALAEAMATLQSLEAQQKADKVRTKHIHVSNPKHTPDLVMDLPITEGPVSPRESGDGDNSSLSSAEMFASSGTSTIKKASSMPRSTSSSAAFSMLNVSNNIKRSNSSSAAMMQRREAMYVKVPEVPEPGDINMVPEMDDSALSSPQESLNSSPRVSSSRETSPVTDSSPTSPTAVQPKDSRPVLQERSSSRRPPPLVKPKPVVADEPVWQPRESPPRTTPERPIIPNKPKVPPKVKPPIMRKPEKPPQI